MIDLREMHAPHPIARKLAPAFDAAALAADLAAMDPTWWARHAGPYHDGGWEAISLWAPRGDRTEQTSRGGAFGPTEAFARTPAVAAVLDHLGAPRNRVRFMRLNPGGHILPHADPLHTIAADLVRLHVPVATNPGVRFVVDGERVVMQPGELWHVDVRFTHEVENAGDAPRVHLVMDLHRTPALDALLAAGAAVRTGSLRAYFLRELAAARARASGESSGAR
jgi:hypothetical protein